MAGPCGAKRSAAKKNVDKENEDTTRSLSASLSRQILQFKCNEHSLVATGSNKLLVKRLFDFFKSNRDEIELGKIDAPTRCKSKRSDVDPSSVLSETTDITPTDPGTSQQSSKPPSIEELAAVVRNLIHIVMDLTDKQKRSKKRKYSPSISTVSSDSSTSMFETSSSEGGNRRTVETTLPLEEIQERHLAVLPDVKTNDRENKMAAIVVQTKKRTEFINHFHPFLAHY